MRVAIAIFCLLASSFVVAACPASETGHAIPGKTTVYSPTLDANLIEFRIEGQKAFVLQPKKPRADGTKPWVWYAPTLTETDGHWKLPTKRHVHLLKKLLDEGFFFCGVDVGESFGNPQGRATFDKFYHHLVDRLGLSPKPCLFPVSRGGLMLYNWAVEHPRCVLCVGGIYPVCNLESWPKLARASKAYQMSEKQLRQELKRHNPVDRIAPLAAAGVPLFHLHGDADTVVPLSENSAELARRYRAKGGSMQILVVRGKGHEIVPEFWQQSAISDFFLKQFKKQQASTR